MDPEWRCIPQWFHCYVSFAKGIFWEGGRGIHSLKLTAKIPRKPKMKMKPDRLPTIHFQVRWLLVLGSFASKKLESINRFAKNIVDSNFCFLQWISVSPKIAWKIPRYGMPKCDRGSCKDLQTVANLRTWKTCSSKRFSVEKSGYFQGHYPGTPWSNPLNNSMGLAIIYHHPSINWWWFCLLILRCCGQGYSIDSSYSWWFQTIWKIWVNIGNLPQVGVNIKNVWKYVWNHHLGFLWYLISSKMLSSQHPEPCMIREPDKTLKPVTSHVFKMLHWNFHISHGGEKGKSQGGKKHNLLKHVPGW